MSKNIEKLISGSNSSTLTLDEEKSLLLIIKNKGRDWEQARSRIIESYLLYLTRCANYYARQPQQIEDLVSEGIIGVMEAIEKFDANKENRLLTFADYYIRSRMSKFSLRNNFNGIFQVPPEVARLCYSVKKFIDDWSESNKDNPPDELLMEKFDLDEASLRSTLNLISSIFATSNILNPEDSLCNLGFRDISIIPPDIEVQRFESNEIVRQIVSKLPERQKFIINKRFGLLDGERMDLASIGAELQLSKQRVAQIEIEALKRLNKEIKRFEISTECFQ